MTQTGAAVAEPGALRLEQCPACGYSLTGLRPVGTCPECGRPYDDQLIVLFGWGVGSHRGAWNGNRRAFIGVGFIYGFNALNALVQGVFLGGVAWTVALVTLAFSGVVFGAAIWYRRTCEMPGLVQVHLSPAGACQLDRPKGTPPDPVPGRRSTTCSPRASARASSGSGCAARTRPGGGRAQTRCAPRTIYGRAGRGVAGES